MDSLKCTLAASCRNSFFMQGYTPLHVQSYESRSTSSDLRFICTVEPHQLRFPTPPTTPPQTQALWISSARARIRARTQSAMKVGEDRSQCEQRQWNCCGFEGLREEDKYMANFMCNWKNCRRFFDNLESLAAHVSKIHAVASSTDGLYYCFWEGCGRSCRGFNARYKMLVHVRTHTKEKPHQCHLCEKSFSRAENLKIHTRTHSGEKPYICPYEGCQKAYSNSSDRFKHTRTHSMEKPYMCKVSGCQKRYTDPSSLRKHIKTFRHAELFLSSNVEEKQHTEGLDENNESDNRSCIVKINTKQMLQKQEDKHCEEQEQEQEDVTHMQIDDEKEYLYLKATRHAEQVDIVDIHTFLGAHKSDLPSYSSYATIGFVEGQFPLDLRIKRDS